MLDIGWAELLVIGIVALIVVGPKDLPKLFQSLGQWVGRARGMARDFQRAMNDAAEESGMSDIKKSFDEAASAKNMGMDNWENAMPGMGDDDAADASPKPTDAKPAASGADDKKAAAPKSAPKKAAAKKAAAKKAAPKSASKPATKPASKPAAQKSAATSGAKKPAAKKSAAKKPAAKKAVT